jgi:hypothetical protein
MNTSYKYICNGKFFQTYQLAKSYAEANDWQITHTEQIKGKVLCHVAAAEKVNPQPKPFTPMSVTGDKAKLISLVFAILNCKYYMKKLNGHYPETERDLNEWSAIIEQAIADEEFEQNRLPINS